MRSQVGRVCGLAVVSSLLAIVGCGGGVARPKTGPQTVSDVLAAVDARTLPKSVQGEARMDAYVNGVARKADLLVRLERPGKAHLQAMTPTGEMVAVLATDGARFTSFERGGKECQTGPACARNLARLVPLALPPNELVDALLGRPPRLQGASSTMRWDGDRGAWHVVLTRAAGKEALKQELWLRPPQMDVLASIVTRDGKRLISIAYAAHGKRGIPGLPGKLRIQMPEQKADVSIELRDVEAGEEIEADAFALPCPRGMPVVELSCDDGVVLVPPPAASGPTPTSDAPPQDGPSVDAPAPEGAR